MTDIPRFTLPELITRYDLEPDLRDAFVEGEFDREVFARCLHQSCVYDYAVYSIDSVDIPYARLVENGLTEGNKQRVITLARTLAKECAHGEYRCVVDRDLDHWFGGLEDTQGLRWTEYCATELYFYSDEIIRDVLLTTAKSRIRDWNQYTASLLSTLYDLYALRLAERELGWSLRWLTYDRCLRRSADTIKFDSADYVRRLLMQNRMLRSADAFTAKVTQWRQGLHGDPRAAIRGHDFVTLLAWTILQWGGLGQFGSQVAVERLLVLMAGRANGLLDLLQ